MVKALAFAKWSTIAAVAPASPSAPNSRLSHLTEYESGHIKNRKVVIPTVRSMVHQ